MAWFLWHYVAGPGGAPGLGCGEIQIGVRLSPGGTCWRGTPLSRFPFGGIASAPMTRPTVSRCQGISAPDIDRDIAPFGIGRPPGGLHLRCRPARRPAVGAGPEGGRVAVSTHKIGRQGYLIDCLEGATDVPGRGAEVAPDPHPEDAVAGGPVDRGERVRVSLLLRCVPGVLASQGRRVSRAGRVPAIGGERPAHEGHAPRAFWGRPGRAGGGDGLAAGIGAARVVECDPAAGPRRLGAMGTGTDTEGRRVRTGQGLNRQILAHTGPGPAMNSGGGIDQVGGQTSDVSGGARQHPGIAHRIRAHRSLCPYRQGKGRTQQEGGTRLNQGGGGSVRVKRVMRDPPDRGVVASLPRVWSKGKGIRQGGGGAAQICGTRSD